MSYLGSKAASGVYQAIIALMPPHDTFIDLFTGSGVILKKKPPAPMSYAVDLDPAAFNARHWEPDVMLANVSARSFIDKFDFTRAGRTLIYADPPYMHHTRSSTKRYKFEMSDHDHLELLRRLKKVPADVILSGYPSKLYDRTLKGWRTMELQAMTRGGVRTEKLWFNFDPTKSNAATYAGRNFTDRQRIKRKAARWRKNYDALPPGERVAVLQALLCSDIDGCDDAAAHRRR